MSLWTLLDGGVSTPQGKTLGQRLSMWVGRRLALRHAGVSADPSALISPAARIHPRGGRIQIGAGTAIAPGVIVQGNVTLGRRCSLQAYAILVGYGSAESPTGLIRIGDDVRIAPMVMMIAANHVFADPDRTIREQGMEHAPITVEDDVWIGGRVTLTAGVTIGRGSVIGAGAVVTRDIPPDSIAVGVPARVIRSRRGRDDIAAGPTP